MTRDTSVQNRTDAAANERQLPNLVTIVGRGVPSNYEVAVDGDLESLADDPTAEGPVVAGSVAEGAIDVGVRRFRFSGEMANVRLVDWNGTEAADSASVPTVHVEYGAPTR
ncbi:hypothetical protein [Natrinema longum]|uniref:Uncharacterized protein n=1 Tax=Natrinema longum TaxID=370324 RepID=A0A8A2UGS8_9EURY|nr:hypothetical protein [Natrinema longum]MBZ6495451.1 hypothetical protein [Natrinema longum]QSW86578.1 hypothetical protein J0X27_07115 [Natrinema longum]